MKSPNSLKSANRNRADRQRARPDENRKERAVQNERGEDKDREDKPGSTHPKGSDLPVWMRDFIRSLKKDARKKKDSD